MCLIQGHPGTGKTTLALQFLLHGVTQGETGLYITLSETHSELTMVAESHGWALDAISIFELSALEQQLSKPNTIFEPSELELDQTTRALLNVVDKTNPKRVVFDSLSELRLLSQSGLRYRRQLLSLKQYFEKKGCTVLMLDDLTGGGTDQQIQSLAHGVISLEKVTPDYGVQRRRTQVVKMRGVAFREGFHDYAIKHGGMHVYPRLIAAEHRTEFPRQMISSGIQELDDLLDGGLDCGTSSLLVGPSGAGKSTLATHYLVNAAKQGQRVAAFTFDESLATFIRRASVTGSDVGALIREGTFFAHQLDPAEVTPGEFAHAIRQYVEEQGVRTILIDSLNGYQNAMPEERYLMLHLHELLSYLSNLGVATLMVLTQHGMVGTTRSPFDLTYLADTVLMLRFYEFQGRVRRALSVLKKRSGKHENAIREMVISSAGLKIGEPLLNFRGVLTGTPVYEPGKASVDDDPQVGQ